MASESLRSACLRSFLDLLADTPYERIALPAVASHAGVPLSELRSVFASKVDLLDAFVRATDLHVLAEGAADGPAAMEESPQERLFEVLMRRLDALEPHRVAVASLLRSARRDPALALHLLRLSTRAQRWMLAAAGIDATGLSGDVRARGLAVLFGRILAVWLEDEDPGLSRTMARLDQELQTGAKLLGMMDDITTIARFGRPRRGAPSQAERDGPAP